MIRCERSVIITVERLLNFNFIQGVVYNSLPKKAIVLEKFISSDKLRSINDNGFLDDNISESEWYEKPSQTSCCVLAFGFPFVWTRRSCVNVTIGMPIGIKVGSSYPKMAWH